VRSSPGNSQSKKDLFEQSIKDAKPEAPKKSWKVTGNSGGISNEGKYKPKTVFGEPPPVKKSISDLP